MIALSLGVSMAFASTALAQFGYGLVGQFNLPAGTAAWDVGPDGRAWALVGDSVYAQAAPGDSALVLQGAVATGTVASWGGSFIRVSGSGTTIAIGDNNFGSGARVHFVNTAALAFMTPGGAPTVSVASGNFDGNWDGNQFYVTGSGSNFVPYVNRIGFSDVTGQPYSVTLVTAVGGGSGGLAIHDGRLYTGVGYGVGGLTTGDIRSFNLLTLNAQDFPSPYSTGTPIIGGPVLSAWPLGFDAAGRLLVGGGDSFGGTTEIGYVAVIDLATGVRQLLSPAGTNTTYGVDFNSALGQIYVSNGGTIYRYAIPAPGAAGLLSLCGIVALRRRLRA